MIGMRYRPECRKIRLFSLTSVFLYNYRQAMKKEDEEEEVLAQPSLPGEAKDEASPLRGSGMMFVAIPVLRGERHVLIDPLQQAMVIPLHFLWNDFLDELGLLLH